MAEVGRLSIFLNLDMRKAVMGIQSMKGHLKGLNSRIISNSAAFKKLGRNLTLLGGAMTAVMGLMVKNAASFETGLAKVNTMLGAGEKHFLPMYRRELQKLATTYGQSLQSLTAGTYDVISAQMGAANAMDIMRQASIAAVGGFTETNIAVSAIITLLNTYSGQLKDAADAADWMHAVVDRGRITFEELAAHLGDTAALFKSAGITVDEYGASIAMLTRGGLEISKAMTALKGIINSVLKAQKEGKDVAKKLGVEWAITAIQGGNFLETLQKLKTAQIEQLATMSPNIRGLLGLAIMQGQAEKSSEDLAHITGRLGLNLDKLAIAEMTLQHQTKKMKQTLTVASIAIGEKLIPAAKKLVGQIIILTEKFIQFAKTHPELVKNIALLVAKLGLLLLIIGPITMSLPGLAIAFRGLATAIIFLNGTVITATASLVALKATIILVGFAVYGIIKSFVDWRMELEKTNNTFKDLAFMLLKTGREAIKKFIKELEVSADKLSDIEKKKIQGFITAEKMILKRIALIMADMKVTEGERQELIALSESMQKLNYAYAKITKRIYEKKEADTEATVANKEHQETVKELVTELTYLQEKIKDLSIETYKSAAEGFRGAFRGVMMGELRTFGDFVGHIANKIRQTWSNMISDMIVQWMFGMDSMGKHTGGGLLGGTWGKIMGMFSGAGSVSYAGTSNTTTAAMGARMGYAGGTDFVPATGLYELHKGEKVVTAADNAKGGGMQINPVVIIQAWDTKDVIRNMDTVANGLIQSLRTNSAFREGIKRYTK